MTIIYRFRRKHTQYGYMSEGKFRFISSFTARQWVAAGEAHIVDVFS